MKLNYLVFPVFFTIAAAQFGNRGGGGFGNLANLGDTLGNRLQQGVRDLRTRLKSVPFVTNVQNFTDFAAQAGKTYATAAEHLLRENVFKSRKDLVERKNAAKGLYKCALNAFADLTHDEFLAKLTGLRKSHTGEQRAKKHRQLAKKISAALPKLFDWRKKGAVTPVKFQGECGACWAFATTGAIEGHYHRKTGKLPILSEQNLIDCGKEEYGLGGCDGGFQEYAFEFVINQKGIAIDEKYPYLDKKESCSYKETLKAAEITSFAVIEPKDEETMKHVVATIGPLACSMLGLETLLVYKEGIYADEECNNGELNHSVLVVGYGTENGLDYWIVKNSWDKNWGEDGFFRLPRGKNFCGIASECSYPII